MFSLSYGRVRKCSAGPGEFILRNFSILLVVIGVHGFGLSVGYLVFKDKMDYVVLFIVFFFF